MITKTDLLLLLTELQDKGVDVNSQINKLMASPTISLDVLKFINTNREFEVSNFYNMVRKNYNTKKSPLYKNLVKEELDNPKEVLTTLAALNLQILLYSNKLDDSSMFLKHSRFEEITKVLNNYAINYDLIPAIKLLKLIKSDLKAFESIK